MERSKSLLPLRLFFCTREDVFIAELLLAARDVFTRAREADREHIQPNICKELGYGRGTMRCLFVADLHYSLPQFDWLLQSAPRYDLVVLAGDALDVASNVDFRAQTLVVRKYLHRIASVTRLIVCSGNHDLDSRSEGEAGEKVARWIGDLAALNIASDGDSLVIENILFTICPWWDGPMVREQLAAQLEADSQRREGLRWVWIHHAPPRNSPTSWSGHRSLGDVELEQWIIRFRPDIVFTGHIHQSPFVQNGSWADQIEATWIFNAGHQFGAPPAHIVLETSSDEAVWISAMGVQAVQLRAPLQRPIPQIEALPNWFANKRVLEKVGTYERASISSALARFNSDRDRDRIPVGSLVPADE
jgi:Icc-related predicted phosphoesterase